MVLITDKLSRASLSNGVRSEPTILSSPKGIGDSSISCDDLSTWDTTTPQHFQLYRKDTSDIIIDSSRSDWKGIVVGNTLTQITLTGGSDDNYATGAYVVCLPTTQFANDLYTGLTQTLNQSDGSLKDNIVTTAKINDNAVTTPKTASAAVTPPKWTNPYKFSAYQTSNQSLPTNTWTKAQLSTEEFDTNNNFDSTSNYRYVVPVNGFYFVYAQVAISTAGTSADSNTGAIYKNGSAVKYGQAIAGSGNAATLPRIVVAGFLQLQANDYLELYAFCGDPTTRSIVGGSDITYMSGFLVSQT